MELILKYFPELTTKQQEQLTKLKPLFSEWNSQINVISRKDMDNFYERHVLHSLAIAKMISFKKGTTLLDVGTGGGLPGIPLAIMFPECEFHLVDSVGKKIKVVNAIVKGLELTNVKTEQCRAEEIKGTYDFVLSRAVSKLGKFYPWVKKNFNPRSKHKLNNGILYLKGGDLTEEIKESRLIKIATLNLSDFFEEEFFETKKIIHVPAQ